MMIEMRRWNREPLMKSPALYVLAPVCLLLAGCSLMGSTEDGMRTQSPVPAQPAIVTVISDGDYTHTCRANGVPIPPDWNPSSAEWERHGNVRTVLLTPDNFEQAPVDDTSFTSVWSYASPNVRGACIAIGRNGGVFQIICQSAATGHACFWSNDPHSPTAGWNLETAEVRISSLRDPDQGFAPGTVPCTECHRGNNAFLYAPDDPIWATVLRSEHVRPTFTTRVENSSHHGQLTVGATTITYPRFIPIGGKSVALNNPLPTATGCSGSCHELHVEIFKKNHTVEGYVGIPRPMGPDCAHNSPPDDPTRNCYQR